MVCGNFILPEPASYVFFYAFSNLRNLLYIIDVSLFGGRGLGALQQGKRWLNSTAAKGAEIGRITRFGLLSPAGGGGALPLRFFHWIAILCKRSLRKENIKSFFPVACTAGKILLTKRRVKRVQPFRAGPFLRQSGVFFYSLWAAQPPRGRKLSRECSSVHSRETHVYECSTFTTA